MNQINATILFPKLDAMVLVKSADTIGQTKFTHYISCNVGSNNVTDTQ